MLPLEHLKAAIRSEQPSAKKKRHVCSAPYHPRVEATTQGLPI